MKADLKAVIQDYKTGAWTIVVSVISATDGTPIPELTEKNFSILAVQTPNGWSTSDVLKVSAVNAPTNGIYVFSARQSGSKNLIPGPYTLAITLGGFKGWAPLNGQTVVSGRLG
jgi:hypothetical protein